MDGGEREGEKEIKYENLMFQTEAFKNGEEMGPHPGKTEAGQERTDEQIPL